MKYSDGNYLQRRKSSGPERLLRSSREREVGRLLNWSGNIGDGGTLLDIGAADGSLVHHLKSEYPSVHFIVADKSMALLTDCSHDVGNRIVADVRKLPLATSCIDVITSVSTLKHVANLASALAELHRVVKPNGRVIVVEPSLLALRIGMAAGHFSREYTPNRMTLGGWHKLFLKAGFVSMVSPRPQRPVDAVRWLLLPYLSLVMRCEK